MRLCRTLHGPVQARAGGVAYARRYAIWGREIETLQGLAAINEAKSVKAVGKDTLKLTWNENIMAADSGGHIGYWHPGLFQLRPKGWDERLPYPGTGEAEWRGLLDRRKDPHVIDPKQGWLANWNNVPAAGRTTGDAESPERLDGGYHRVHLLQLRVAKLAKKPSYAGAKRVIQITGTTAQARPVATARLKAARKGSKGAARTVLQPPAGLGRLVHARRRRQRRRPGRGDLGGVQEPGPASSRWPGSATRAARSRRSRRSSHMFDTSYAEAFALRTLSDASLRRVAAATAAALTTRFGTADADALGRAAPHVPADRAGRGRHPGPPVLRPRDLGGVRRAREVARGRALEPVELGEVAHDPVGELDRRPGLGRQRRRRRGGDLADVVGQAVGHVAQAAQGDERGAAHHRGVGGPHDLEAVVVGILVCSSDGISHPAMQIEHVGASHRNAHSRAPGSSAETGDLDHPARLADLLEGGDDDGRVGQRGERVPAMLGLAVGRLVLEGAEDERALGPGHRLVLEGAGELQQHAAAHLTAPIPGWPRMAANSVRPVTTRAPRTRETAELTLWPSLRARTTARTSASSSSE